MSKCSSKKRIFWGKQQFAVWAFLIVLSSSAFAQATGEWAWMGGNKASGTNGINPGVYGTLGTPAAANLPGSRFYAATWTDNNGNLWLFGGVGSDADGSSNGLLNDFWEFNPQTKQWTWMGGSKTAKGSGVYGTLGVPDAKNTPTARYAPVSWTDNDGNFWLFGGTGNDATGKEGVLNDLWKFDPAAGVWTWMGGNSTLTCASGPCSSIPGVYGTLQQPAPTNYPSSREESTGWTDQNGNLWLFSGNGVDSKGNFCLLNDLWKYDIAAGEWGWMSGMSTCSSPGSATPSVFGTKGVAASTNVPGGRYAPMSWTGGDGNLWLFGGSDASNDLWMFNTTTLQWTWVGGSQTASCGSGVVCQPAGVYGNLGDPAPGNNTPGYRLSSLTWSDDDGNLWLMGGIGYDANGHDGVLNDLWLFNIATSQWTWMGGSSTLSCSENCNPVGSVYGTLGVPSSANVPGSRFEGQRWTDNYGNFWLFSGNYSGGSTQSNDLWEYFVNASPSAPNTLVPAAIPAFDQPAGTYQSNPLSVGITVGSNDSSARLYYTTNGSRPTTKSAPCNASAGCPSATAAISAKSTIKAFVVKSGFANSAIVQSKYDFQAATPTFSLAAGTYGVGQALQINDASSGAVIYYTTDGTTPTTKSTQYSGPIALSKSVTINALATVTNETNSPVATAAYTIIPPSITNLSPLVVTAGGPAFTLTVNGIGFASGATIYWNTTALTTQFVSSTQLTASVAASLLASAGQSGITVHAPSNAGTSNSFLLEVDPSGAGTGTAPTFPTSTSTVSSGSTATYPVTLPSGATNVSINCLNLPTGATCAFSSANSTVTITTLATTPKGSYPITIIFTETLPGAAASFVLLPLLLSPFALSRRKTVARLICVGFACLSVAVFAVGCGGGSSPSTTTPPPTTATHQVTTSTSVTLTVQ